MVVIRLARGGRKGTPVYKVMVQDKNAKLKGRFLEKIGTYQPSVDKNDYVQLDTTRYNEWLSKGAVPSPRVVKLLNEFYVKNPEAKQAAPVAAPKAAKAEKSAAPKAEKTEKKDSRQSRTR